MKYWNLYTATIKRNCSHPEDGKGLAYWRDNLFEGTVIFLFPLTLAALIPGLFWCFLTGMFGFAVVIIFTFLKILTFAFVPGIRLVVRKIIFIQCIYIFTIATLYYLDLTGPGLLYLLAGCILSIFIFPAKYAFWPAWLNTLICVCFVVLTWYGIVPWKSTGSSSTGEWIVACANLIFLSFFSAALIPRLFAGLQETIDKEKHLKEDLNKQQQSLEHALYLLQQKNNELEQFAYTVSHDLKEPLRMVTSFMGIVKRNYEKDLDEKALSFINFAIEGGARMQQMINGLLELSRTGRSEADREKVDLNEILQEVKQNISRLMEEARATIIVQSPLPVIFAYKTDISRLFQNLLSNAIKFRKTGIEPVIRLNVVEKESLWEFSIQDNGIGMQKKNLERVFEVFTRLHSQSAYEGTGLGLAICKKIVELNGGRICVESEEGKGSTFIFTLKK
ncbi:MAG: hypothetical protein JWP81_1985 [Ferruginibacter sp.]|nr:hypothetical protein [Ferruginibacter sp.]